MFEVYHIENERLKTFQKWPLFFISKEILAKTGFLFTGDDDKVKCCFCEVEIGRWESTDNPISEHLRWSPNCPLLRRRPTNNVPIDAESLNKILPLVIDDAVKKVRSNVEKSIPINSLPNSVNLGTLHAFIHPEYANKAVRLSSFTDWPCSMKQKPEQLSEAGFFYTGIDDRVKCFSCGCGLMDWDEADDPWEQHALWVDNCHYLKLMKGDNCIQAVSEKFKTVKKESKNIASTELNKNEKSEDMLQHCCCCGNKSNTNNDLNINQALMTLMIMNRIDAALLSTSSGSDEENWDNLSTNSQSSHETEEVSSEHDALENEPHGVEENCDHLSPITQNYREAEDASLEQDAFENEGTCSDEQNCDNLSTNLQSSEETETCKRTKLYSHRPYISREFEESKKRIIIYEAKLCKICYVAQYETAFLPCGHVVACNQCASSVEKCPICRNVIEKAIRLYFS